MFMHIFGGNGGNDGRIESAGKKRAERNIAFQLSADSVFQEIFCMFDGIVAAFAEFMRFQLPITFQVYSLFVECAAISRLELENIPEYAAAAYACRRHEKQLPKPCFVEYRFYFRVFQQGFYFRTENKGGV